MRTALLLGLFLDVFALGCACNPTPGEVQVSVQNGELGTTVVVLANGLLPCSRGCAFPFELGAIVRVTPNPGADLQFSGVCRANGAECNVLAPGRVKVAFGNADGGGGTVRLSVVVAGEGVVASLAFPAQCSSLAPCDVQVPRGEHVRLEATTASTAHVSWNVDCAGALCDLVVDRDTMVLVTFTLLMRLSVSGVGFPDAGAAVLDGERVVLPHEVAVSAGSRHVLEAATPVGFTSLGISGVSCHEVGWSLSCTFDVAADTAAQVSVAPFVRWARLTTYDDGVNRGEWESNDFATLADGGAVVLGTIHGNVRLNGQLFESPPASLSAYFLGELGGDGAIGAWSANRGLASGGGGWDAFLHETPEGLFGSVHISQTQGLPTRLQWGAVDAGVLPGNGEAWALLRLDGSGVWPVDVAILGRDRQLGVLSPTLLPRRGVRHEENRARFPMSFRGTDLPGVWLPPGADGGMISATLTLTPNFATQRFEAPSALGADLLPNGLSSSNRLVVLRAIIPTRQTVDMPVGCLPRQSAVAEYSSVGAGQCTRFEAVVDAPPFEPLEFLASQGAGWLVYKQGSGATHQLGVRRLDPQTLRPVWDTTLGWPKPAQQVQALLSEVHSLAFDWGGDLLLVWADNWTDTRPGVRTPEGALIPCASPSTTTGSPMLDYYLVLLDGDTGRVKWADCLPGTPAGATVGAFAREAPVGRFGDGLLLHPSARNGGVARVGETEIDTTSLQSAPLLIHLTPPRFR